MQVFSHQTEISSNSSINRTYDLLQINYLTKNLRINYKYLQYTINCKCTGSVEFFFFKLYVYYYTFITLLRNGNHNYLRNNK